MYMKPKQTNSQAPVEEIKIPPIVRRPESAELLKDHEFAEFLSRFDDFKEVTEQNDVETLQKRFEMFQQKERLIKDLREMYRGDIKDSVGLELSDADLEDVDDYVENLALADAESFFSLVDSFSVLKRTEQAVAGYQAKVEEYKKVDSKTFAGESEKKLNRVATKIEAIQQALDTEQFFGPSGKLKRGVHKIWTFGLGRHESETIREIISKPKKAGGFGFKLDFESLIAELQKAQKEFRVENKQVSERADLLKMADKNQQYIQYVRHEIFSASDLSDQLAKVAKKVADEKFRDLLADPKYEEAISQKEAELIVMRKKLADLTAKAAQAGRMDEGDINLEIVQMAKEIETLEQQEIAENPISEKTLAEAQKILDGIQSGTTRRSVYIAEISPEDVAKMSNEIEDAVSEAITFAIERTKVDAKGFDAMEQVLKSWLTKDAIGQMTGGDVKVFLHDCLEGTINGLPDDKESKLKIIFVHSLMHKYGLAKTT